MERGLASRRPTGQNLLGIDVHYMIAARARERGLVDVGGRQAEASQSYGKLLGNSDPQAQSATEEAQFE